MPNTPLFRPNHTARAVEIVAFGGVQLLDVAGPLQAFATANDLATLEGAAVPYRLSVVAPGDGTVVTSASLGLVTAPLPVESAPGPDTLIVAGGFGTYAALEDARFVAWIAARAARSGRVAAVCTGAFLLAAAGVLDGRRAVTHWTRCAALADRFPAVRVEPDPIFIRDGPVWTSAGITAGIDLALALLEEDLGHGPALAVARHLVVFLKRPGGQSQFSTSLSLQHAQADCDGRFGALHIWAADNLTMDLSVPALAARAGMSERSFRRHYRAAVGITPAEVVERLRVEAAQRMLTEAPRLPVKRVAMSCGFGSEETMRRAFIRRLATSPYDYRARFCGAA